MKVQVLVLLLHVAVRYTYVAGVNEVGNDADFQTFMANVIETFTEVAHFAEREQFAVVVMVSQQELTNWDVNYQPSDGQGPLIDVYQPLSPCNQNHLVNFIVARPSDTGVYAEQQILPHLAQLLQCFQQANGGQDPASIILYSRICPCRACTDNIIQSFDDLNLPPKVRLAVTYATAGNVTDVDTNYSWRQLTADSFGFFRYGGNCGGNRGPFKRSLDDLEQVSDCRPLQRYLLDQLGNTLECCVSSAQPKRATADLINRLMGNCMSELDQLDSCLGKAAKKILGDYCSCENGFATAAQLSKYVKQAMHSSLSNLDMHFISHPLDPNNPTHITGPITEREQLQSYDDSVTYSCNDNRQEGLMCSILQSNYLTAGKSICRQDHPCGTHGYSYSWCYVEATGWEYCCTGSCQDGTCESGSSWQHCNGDIGYVTAGNTVCKTDFPCGLHGERYTWCYTEYGWEYCCTDDCSYRGENYRWCNAGSTWEYCGQYDNGKGLSTVTNSYCLPGHQCGKHGEYHYKNWCYTNSQNDWDYCCAPGKTCFSSPGYDFWCYTGENDRAWQYCNNIASTTSHDELRKRNKETQIS